MQKIPTSATFLLFISHLSFTSLRNRSRYVDRRWIVHVQVLHSIDRFALSDPSTLFGQMSADGRAWPDFLVRLR
jgi:hypothetical protein